MQRRLLASGVAATCAALAGFGCRADQQVECRAFMLLARSAQQDNQPAPKTGSIDELLERRAERYSAYATELEKMTIEDAELGKLVRAYITHVRGSADLARDLRGRDPKEAFAELAKRDDEGRKVTAQIDAYCRG
jgi:hypothetical protein